MSVYLSLFLIAFFDLTSYAVLSLNSFTSILLYSSVVLHFAPQDSSMIFSSPPTPLHTTGLPRHMPSNSSLYLLRDARTCNFFCRLLLRLRLVQSNLLLVLQCQDTAACLLFTASPPPSSPLPVRSSLHGHPSRTLS